MIDALLLPAVGVLVALLGLYTDAKEKPFGRSAIIIIVLFIVTGLLTGMSAYVKEGESRDQEDLLSAQSKTILVLSQKVTGVSQQVTQVSTKADDIQEELASLGGTLAMRPDRISTNSVATALQAHSALEHISTPETAQAYAKIPVWYFPHKLDQEVVTGTAAEVSSREMAIPLGRVIRSNPSNGASVRGFSTEAERLIPEDVAWVTTTGIRVGVERSV